MDSCARDGPRWFGPRVFPVLFPGEHERSFETCQHTAGILTRQTDDDLDNLSPNLPLWHVVR